MPEDIKTKVAQRLAGGGTLSSRDLAAYAAPKPKEAVTEDAMSKASTVSTLPKAAQGDPAIAAAATPSSGEEAAAQIEQQNKPPDGMQQEPVEPIVITPDDKRQFLEAVVTAGRFTKPFSLFGGKISGLLRSRTARESHAMLAELRREYIVGEILGDLGYGDRMRWFALRFQVQELNGIEYPPPAEPLLAQKVLDDKGGEKTHAPRWVEEALTFFSKNESDAIVAALYREVNKFEKLYWALVSHAGDQNFWQTEGATSA